MPETGLLFDLALALIAAAIGASISVRLGQSAILGYIVVGILIGPYTPGPVGQPETVAGLADLGLIFLLFAIGLQLSFRDLLAVGRVAVAGSTLQVLALIALGFAVAVALGFSALEGLFFGAFAAMSSTTVMAKILSERGEIDSEHGHLALAWATVQDLATIVLVVLLGGLSAGGNAATDIPVAVGKAVLFMAILLPLGTRVLPWLFEHVALLRSREVFVLSVVAIALGTAYVSELFGLSLALGAFLAGLLVSESDISYQVLGELGPLRDVFAGVFFVSVGMLVDPGFVVAALPLVLVAVAVVVPVKGAITAGLARVLGTPLRTSLLAGVALAQAGEFSFLLARIGVEAGAVGGQMFSLMLAAAGASIVIAPWLQRGSAPAVRRTLRWLDHRAPLETAVPPRALPHGRYVIICGFDNVGRMIAAALERRAFPYVVVESDPRVSRSLRGRGVDVVQGSAENPRVLERAVPERARAMVVTLPDPLALRQVVQEARRINPRLPIVARARTSADHEFLERAGVGEIVSAETEAALEMARYTLSRLGVSATETQAIVQGLRRRASGG
ncbi:MAG TPA: cation:proton antiporter [Candidatus Caenarcaniphilales bacterium]|nr:cation:proton antiporter [Candidatus Caenarcaniphilales bacterium]